jgi:formate-dependent nitrite reductase membrane component NrfD
MNLNNILPIIIGVIGLGALILFKLSPMNLNNILLITIGVIGVGTWILFMAVFSVMALIKNDTDPEKLRWLTSAGFMWIELIFSIAAVGFGIYNWRR